MEESQKNEKENNIYNESGLKSYNTSNSNVNLNQNDNEEIEDEEKKEIDPSKEIELLYESLIEFYSKKQFKKILKAMILKSDKDEKFNLLEWKLLYLRTLTLFRIVSKKSSTYHKTSKIPHFSEYIQKINNDIYNWISFTQELKIQNETKYIEPFIEFIIFFILQKINLLSKNYIHSGHIKDAIGILSLGVKIINKSFYNFKSPDSYELSAEIFLSLSSIMIAEENYNAAKYFISISIKFSFLTLEIKLFKNGINYKIFNFLNYNNEIKHFSKILFFLSVAFYHLGICYENENDPYNAFFAMKTSKYIGEIIDNFEISEFIEVVTYIETRLLMRNRILLFFEKNVKKEEVEEEVFEIKKEYNVLFDREERRNKKFKSIEKKIEKIKLVEIDDDEPDLFKKVGSKPLKEKVLKTTKQINLLNYLMNDDFKEVVNKIKKLKINKLDKNTINIIQKKIISLKNNEREKLEKKKNNKKRIIKRKISKEKSEKLKLLKNPDKSNTISTSMYSFTSSNIRKPRINSAYKSTTSKNILTTTYDHQSTKSLKTYNERPLTTGSIYIYSPSKYLSLYDSNNYPNNKKQFFYNKDKIISNKKTLYSYSNFKSFDTQSSKKKKNIFKYNSKYIPNYNYNKFYFNKRFRNKYKYLETQYDKEITFQKQLLRTKFNKEVESIKPNPVDVRDIYKKVDELYYTTFENELMNAKEKQIIFDKAELMNINKSKGIRGTRRIFNPEHKILSYSNKGNKNYNSIQIQEMNEDCINDITNKILKISSQEKDILRKKRKIFK